MYGSSSLLEIAKVRALSKPPGVMLGVESRRARSKIVSYPLEGAMVTIAQPRTGKSSLIAANLLNPNNGGLQGSVVYIDLRSEGWFVTSDKRKQDKRNVVLIDPFGLVEQNAKAFPELKHHIGQKVDRYNPLDFVRRDKNAVEDIGVLLQAILTPPKSGGSASAQHFYESCEAIIGGLIAWVIFSNEPNKTLARVRELLLQEKQAMDTLSEMVGESQDLGFGMPWEAIRRLNSAGDSESGSNLSSVANQLSFLKYPAVQQSMSVSTFNPEVLVDGNTDLYVVAPDNLVGEIKGWIRLWVTIPNAVPNRTPFKMKMLMIIDELPKIGFLQPVMDAYSMAAGKGVLFWTLIQSVSALEASWGKAAAKVILDLAEVIQVLGTPLGSTEDAEQLSRVIGEATYETHTESQSGTVSGTSVVGGRQSSQEGLSTALVRGRAVPTDMIQNLAADEQIVVTGSKIHKGAFKIILMKYWTHTSCKNLFGLNPFVLKDMSEEDRKKAHDKILKRQEKTYTPVKRST
ncbi:MAG: type IV secretory system conjugative DNA transfer family protein [Proteobacteria bacterium]|nr:type IV secretory system conjugative DNA transfer family protein [Pseudomonadota bacterium]